MSIRILKKEDGRYYIQENSSSTLWTWQDKKHNDGLPISFASRHKAEKMYPEAINKFSPIDDQ